jgi:hypothetical protein
MSKRRSILLAVLGLAVVCVALSMAGFLLYNALRRRALEERPLVLIHSPLHLEAFEVSDGLLVHATARSESGISRIELWADGEYVAARENPETGPVSLLVFTAGYQPATLGSHTLVVRATSAGGVDGQSTVAIHVVEAVADADEVRGTHFVDDPAETLESIAEEYGTTEEELRELNPDLVDEGPEPGDVVEYPEDSPPADAEPETDEPGEPGGEDREPAPPADEDEAPTSEDAAPGSLMEVMELLGIHWPFGGLLGDETATLQVEALSLETGAEYESVHCYIGVGDNEPLWYPDDDLDQASDESFASLGGGLWDIAAHLSGDRAPTFNWPREELLPIDVTCVAVGGGGSEPLDLGHLLITARPLAWDGVTRRAVGGGEDGEFSLDYRVSETEGAPRGIPCWLDLNMTPPNNARLDDRRYSIHWDYYPDDDEEPIDGFRIYLNNTLQWVEDPDARESGLPPQWFNPPCGDEYRFHVTAFRYGFPDGPESMPSNHAVAEGDEPGSPSCERQVLVSFDTLQTLQLPGDGRYDPGDVGPVYGRFYAGDQEVTFDGRCEGSGICSVFALHHNREYDISSITDYFGSGPARFVVTVPNGENLEMGYSIRDGDTHNPDDDVCDDWWYVFDDDMDRTVSHMMEDWDRHCQVSYTVEPLYGDPVVEPGELPPLPMLGVTDLTVDEASGDLLIHINNRGAAAWPAHDLEIALFWPSGEGIGAFTEEDFFMEAGATTVVRSQVTPDPPLGACILLDPGNQVPEEDDRSLGWTRGRWCRDLPDLTILGSGYDADEEMMAFRVQNIGEGSIEDRDMDLRIELPDGHYFAAPSGWWSDVSIEPRQTVRFEWPGINEDQRLMMTIDGYTVIIDPNNDIAEEDGTNNTLEVGPATRLWLSWTWVSVPYDYRRSAEFDFYAYVRSIGGSRRVADWHVEDIDWGSCFEPHYCVRHYDNNEYDTYWFDVAGDEELSIRMVLGDRSAFFDPVISEDTYGPEDDWGAGPTGPRRTCEYLGGADSPAIHTWVFDYSGGDAWDATFHICWEDYPD